MCVCVGAYMCVCVCVCTRIPARYKSTPNEMKKAYWNKRLVSQGQWVQRAISGPAEGRESPSAAAEGRRGERGEEKLGEFEHLGGRQKYPEQVCLQLLIFYKLMLLVWCGHQI